MMMLVHGTKGTIANQTTRRNFTNETAKTPPISLPMNPLSWLQHSRHISISMYRLPISIGTMILLRGCSQPT